ncbi:MAG: hypothetical protein Q7U57_09555 [Methylovulum sp.]|nr:hypothetical protein [Methylovulum sp.]
MMTLNKITIWSAALYVDVFLIHLMRLKKMTMKTIDIFQEHKPPRKKPRVLMHVIDVDGDPCDQDKPIAQFQRRKCGTISDWLNCDNVTEVKRGIPCKKCNA